MTPQEYQQMRDQGWIAQKAWIKLYHAGRRITWDDKKKTFRFWQCPWPERKRIAYFGEFSRFDCTEVRATPEELEAVEQYGDLWLSNFFPKSVPEALSSWFYHPLNADYEVPTLHNLCLDRGIVIHAVPFDGGAWPMIANTKAESVERAEVREMPELLTRYLKEESAQYVR